MIENIKGIELQLLICPKCSCRLQGQAESIFVYCSNCHSGFEIDSNGKYCEIPVYFVRTTERASRYMPYWAFDASLDMIERERKGAWKTLFSSNRGLASLFQERGVIRFYVPAYSQDFSEKNPAGLNLTMEQPKLEGIHALPEVGDVTVTRRDAEKIADFIFLTSEMSLPDVVQKLEYRLELKNPFLIVIGM